MATLSLARKGAIILGATLALATLSGSAEARYYGCWGCGAIAGAAIAAPYAPPVYYAPRPVYVAPPVAPVYVAPAPVVAYPVCPALPPYPYYCR